MSPHSPAPDTRKGILYGLTSAFAFGLMGFGVHCGANRIPSSEVSFARALFGFLVLLPFAWPERARLVSRMAVPIWLRSLAGGLSVLCYFANLQKTGVGSATALADLSPVFVALLSWGVFRESLALLEFLGIITAVAAVLILHASSMSIMSSYVLITGLAGAVFGGVAYVSLRRASVKFSSPVVVCCFSGVTCISALAGGIHGWHWPESRFDGALMFGVALSGLAGQIYMTRSYMHLKAPIACGLGVSALAWGMLWDAIFHADYPKGIEWFGYVLLMAGVYLLQARTPRRKPISMLLLTSEPASVENRRIG